MRLGKPLCAAILAVCALAPSAFANIVTPGNAVVPDVFTGQSAGTLLATLSAPFNTLGTGTVISAIYREAGGTLDFYYQVSLTSGIPLLSVGGAGAGFDGLTTDV